ncbi:cytoplasmic dynein 1 heavy chain 1-like [Seriola lalandi dorsalis]|uniref:cytoplasmic dynein 1 heavy chain 1-like n=1 Tax=Seriola lalandi dorsalis TaxID=1841481 RepID=UPI000C6F706C|nr:cytoplasmic dynein 1 heavy chain 1-like [Seriola lalandi dorsalis]
MAQSIYGGRIDNEFDQRLLITFLDRIFTKGSFDSEFKLALKVDGHKDIKMPDGIRREEFMHWVEMLPDTQTPSWLGLPSNAEKVLLTTQGMLQPVVFIICTLLCFVTATGTQHILILLSHSVCSDVMYSQDQSLTISLSILVS